MAHLSMYWGISGLKHPSLVKNFYPEDLPQSWYLDYYSNEFDLLLTLPEELQCIDDPADSVEDKEFVCLIADNSNAGRSLPDNFVGFDAKMLMRSIEQVDGIQWQWSEQSISDGNAYLCVIKEIRSTTPTAIKELIEAVKERAGKQGINTLYVVFDDARALENCRNAVVLESMM